MHRSCQVVRCQKQDFLPCFLMLTLYTLSHNMVDTLHMEHHRHQKKKKWSIIDCWADLHGTHFPPQYPPCNAAEDQDLLMGETTCPAQDLRTALDSISNNKSWHSIGRWPMSCIIYLH